MLHASLGFLITLTSIGVVVLSLNTKKRGVVLASMLGLLAVLSAVSGGVSFVLSGFRDNGYSAQMGGSFIAAYALFFIVLLLKN